MLKILFFFTQLDSRTWHNMTENQRNEHIERFRSYTPVPTDLYKMPATVGRKPGDKQRKRQNTEPHFVEERVKVAKVPKLKITKKGKDNFSATIPIDLSKLNPKVKRKKEKPMELRLKAMHVKVTK